MMQPLSIEKTVDHLFRHESGKMVAVLSKLLGLQHLHRAQDIVQDTLLQALTTWTYNGLPQQPSAWLYRVAKNKAIDFLRREKTFRHIQPQLRFLLQSEYTLSGTIEHLFQEEEIKDSQLQLMFACCHPSIPQEGQIALILKTLCGLSTTEISNAFLKEEEAIAKRIYRAKEKIKAERIELEMPPAAQLPGRLNSVLHCLYLLFNEGYNSSAASQLIREDLCEEAMRMAYLLTQNSITNTSATNALLALFCFQASRLQCRLDEGGNIILLRYQDRKRWHRPLIEKGFFFLEAATEKELSFYHLEAAIAYLHTTAPNFEATDWIAIHHLYTILYSHHATPVIALNKAIASSYAIDKNIAIKELQAIKGLDNYYLYHTAIGEIYFELDNYEEAKAHYKKALALSSSVVEQQLLRSKIEGCFTCSMP